MKKVSSAATTMKFRIDENEVDNFSKVKKNGANGAAEQTKRSALGDLQNRGVLNSITGKDTVQRDLKVLTKARVDSYWKKPSLASRTNNIKNVPSVVAACAAQNKSNEGNKLDINAGLGQRKVMTRSNSMRVAGNITGSTTSIMLQRHGSIIVGQNKAKTLTTKVIENKVLQEKQITSKCKNNKEDKKAVEPSLRREDSNLSRKSLSKFKAALSRGSNGANKVDKSKTMTESADSTAAAEKTEKKAKQILKAPNSDIKIVSVQTQSPKLLEGVEDIDASDSDNLMLVSDYVNDIYNYLFSLELIHSIRPEHLSEQNEIYPKMRAVLIDWINEVHIQFHCSAETFQMAVAIIDRYLQAVTNTKRSHLQLVGVTSLFIAAKYEELFPPAINDFVYITDRTYSTQQILQMEIKIMKVLDFNLSRPLPLHFLRRFSKAANAEDLHHAMSKYFVELTLIEYDFAHYKPSEIAAASLFLSLHLIKGDSTKLTGFDNSQWTPTCEFYSRYSSHHLRPIARKIAVIARNAATTKLKAVYTKYQSANLLKISLRPELSSALLDSIINSKD